MPIPTEEDLLQHACHIGHKASKWNPKIKPFLYGTQEGIHVFDLTKTRQQLEKACSQLLALHKKGKSILFISTKQFSTGPLEKLGLATGQPTVTKKWIPGLLTNWKAISQRIKYYLDLKQSFQTGEVEKYTKKEQVQLRKKLTQLENALSGVAGMTGLPDAIFVVDAVRDDIAVREACKMGIPVFGVCDSNADPDFFSVPIPCNDDAVNSVNIILSVVQNELAGATVEHSEKNSKKKELTKASV